MKLHEIFIFFVFTKKRKEKQENVYSFAALITLIFKAILNEIYFLELMNKRKTVKEECLWYILNVK